MSRNVCEFSYTNFSFDVLGGTTDSFFEEWAIEAACSGCRPLGASYLYKVHHTGWEVTHAGSQSAARLDRWLVCYFLLGSLRAADVGVGADQLPSDHRAVYIALRAGRQGPALDKGPWRCCTEIYIIFILLHFFNYYFDISSCYYFIHFHFFRLLFFFRYSFSCF